MHPYSRQLEIWITEILEDGFIIYRLFPFVHTGEALTNYVDIFSVITLKFYHKKLYRILCCPIGSFLSIEEVSLQGGTLKGSDVIKST